MPLEPADPPEAVELLEPVDPPETVELLELDDPPELIEPVFPAPPLPPDEVRSQPQDKVPKIVTSKSLFKRFLVTIEAYLRACG